MTIQSIETLKELDAILASSSNRVIVLKFHAEWCPPCKKLGPKVEAISSDYPTLIFLTADTDQVARTLKSRYDISSLPNTLFLKPDDGETLEEVLGDDFERIEKLCKKWSKGFLGVGGGGGEVCEKSSSLNNSCKPKKTQEIDEATKYIIQASISNIDFLEKEKLFDAFQAKVLRSNFESLLDPSVIPSKVTSPTATATSPTSTPTPTPSRSISSRPISMVATKSTSLFSSAARSKVPPPPPSASIPSPPIPKKSDSQNKVIALWDYKATAEDEISFKEGDIIIISEKTSDDWWKGSNLTNNESKKGLLPSAYVEDLETARQVLSNDNATAGGSRNLPPAYSGEDKTHSRSSSTSNVNNGARNWKAPVARFSSNGDSGVNNVREGAPVPQTEEQKAKADRLKKLGGTVGTHAAGGFGAGIGFGLARSIF